MVRTASDSAPSAADIHSHLHSSSPYTDSTATAAQLALMPHPDTEQQHTLQSNQTSPPMNDRTADGNRSDPLPNEISMNQRHCQQLSHPDSPAPPAICHQPHHRQQLDSTEHRQSHPIDSQLSSIPEEPVHSSSSSFPSSWLRDRVLNHSPMAWMQNLMSDSWFNRRQRNQSTHKKRDKYQPYNRQHQIHGEPDKLQIDQSEWEQERQQQQQLSSSVPIPSNEADSHSESKESVNPAPIGSTSVCTVGATSFTEHSAESACKSNPAVEAPSSPITQTASKSESESATSITHPSQSSSCESMYESLDSYVIDMREHVRHLPRITDSIHLQFQRLFSTQQTSRVFDQSLRQCLEDTFQWNADPCSRISRSWQMTSKAHEYFVDCIRSKYPNLHYGGFEPVQLIAFESSHGGRWKPHFDNFIADVDNLRQLAFIIFLQTNVIPLQRRAYQLFDDEEHDNTADAAPAKFRFPALRVSIVPVAGCMIAFALIDKQNDILQESLNEIEEVKTGDMWCAVTFYRTRSR